VLDLERLIADGRASIALSVASRAAATAGRPASDNYARRSIAMRRPALDTSAIDEAARRHSGPSQIDPKPPVANISFRAAKVA